MGIVDYIFICVATVDSILMLAFICFGNIENKYKAFVSWLVLSLLSMVLIALFVYYTSHPFCNLNGFLNLNWLL